MTCSLRRQCGQRGSITWPGNGSMIASGTHHHDTSHKLGNFTDRYSFQLLPDCNAHFLIFQPYLLHWDAGLWPWRPEGQHHPEHRGVIPPLLPLTSILRWPRPQVNKLKLTGLQPETQPILYRWQLILKS